MRGWMVSLGLAGMVVVTAMVARSLPVGDASRDGAPYEVQADELGASSDPCFRYGRFECCVRPEDG